jgi:ParB family transcriptional regulator, chromosome partitioning protein
MQAQKRRLGRGLAALIGDDSEATALPPEEAVGLRDIPIEHIHRNPANPRKAFREEELKDLAASIRAKGVLQPIVVRPREAGGYEIVAGERRWRAAQQAGIHDMPAVIRELSDGETLEIAIIENIQRADLNPLEEARAFSQLMDQFSYTQQQLADSIGKSRSHIANTLRLLNLPPTVRSFIEEGKLTAGHARALVASDSPHELAQQIITLGLSVRQAEDLSRNSPAGTKKAKFEKNADVKAFEKQLSEATGLKVEIKSSDREHGQLVIHYKNFDQLEDVSRRLAAAKR